MLYLLDLEPMNPGEQLKRWRKAKGLTQEELASAVGIGPAYMSNLERDIAPNTRSGKPRASEDLCHQFAIVLGIEENEVRALYRHAPLDSNTPVSAKEALEVLGRIYPELGGLLGADGLTDEQAADILADFIMIMKIRKDRENHR